jgi:NAD(P)-dependent dehydrogenase (short-subunit alcohol dehydrogenase family)
VPNTECPSGLIAIAVADQLIPIREFGVVMERIISISFSSWPCRWNQEDARININSVPAGYISTGMIQAVRKEALDKARVKSRSVGSASGRGGRVSSSSADRDSAFITGQIYWVNGGQDI